LVLEAGAGEEAVGGDAGPLFVFLSFFLWFCLRFSSLVFRLLIVFVF
jgi:hypothetical protein